MPNWTACCSGLDKLSHPTDPGLGLMIFIRKRARRFLLMYKKDWKVSDADAGIGIEFCPFCGTKLTKLFRDVE